VFALIKSHDILEYSISSSELSPPSLLPPFIYLPQHWMTSKLTVPK
jgi:hypothetical protein